MVLEIVFLVIALVSIAVIFYAKHEDEKVNKTWWLVPITCFVLFFLVGSLFTIDAGHRGVLLRFGKVESTRLEGLNVKLPLIDKVAKMSVQTQLYSVEATAASRDLQDVKTSIGLNYRLDPFKVGEVYQTLGITYIERIAAPAVQEVVKAVTARYNAEDLILRREHVKDDIAAELTTRLAARGIIAEIVNITDFQFGEDFTKAIEQKVVAQQNILKAQYELEMVTIQAQQILVKAQAQDEANIILSKNLTPQLLQYILIDRLGDDIKIMVVPAGQGLAIGLDGLR
jgi:regulator of protease activity HflC (stomatin/prohibitin superfamily)